MKRTHLPLLVLLLAGLQGCRHEVPPVATLDVQPRSVVLGYPQATSTRLTWTPETKEGGEAPAEPLVFVHLLDAKGVVVRTFDHPFPQRWAAGVPVSYDLKLYQSALAPPLDPGRYRLGIGLVDRAGKRWPLAGLGPPIGRNEYLAADVEATPQPAGPQFGFSPAWLPLQAGTDKQVLARRLLSDQPGEIRVEAIPGPGSVWLTLRIPLGDGGNEKVVFHDPATTTPAVVVRGTCGSVETGISGSGPHEVEMPVGAAAAAGASSQGAAGAGGGGCRISLVPNFHIVSPASPEPYSVALQVLSWAPAGARAGGGAEPPGSRQP
jgi:hypothetical protein